MERHAREVWNRLQTSQPDESSAVWLVAWSFRSHKRWPKLAIFTTKGNMAVKTCKLSSASPDRQKKQMTLWWGFHVVKMLNFLHLNSEMLHSEIKSKANILKIQSFFGVSISVLKSNLSKSRINWQQAFPVLQNGVPCLAQFWGKRTTKNFMKYLSSSSFLLAFILSPGLASPPAPPSRPPYPSEESSNWAPEPLFDVKSISCDDAILPTSLFLDCRRCK